MSRQFNNHWDSLSDEERMKQEYDEYRAGVDDKTDIKKGGKR